MDDFQKTISNIFDHLKSNCDGNVADYIPQLAKVNPDLFAISVCDTSGRVFNIGDTEIDFCLQSCSKPLMYCMARHKYKNKIHKHIGYEPSGQAFNAFVLDKEGHPHNPMINAGAIMTCSLIEPDLEPALRFDAIQENIKRMSGNKYKIGFCNSVFLSEKKHADRNYALAYFMNERKAFPPGTDLSTTLDLYFQSCSITINSSAGSVIAATLAMGGVCPITGERIYSKETVRDCLALMYQCGMYDYSGQFAFKIGLPAKSGVSGCLFLVVPNKYGICIWSPRLDEMGNSVRGVQFCHALTKKYNFHLFHNVMDQSSDSSLNNSCSSDDQENNKIVQ